MKLKIFAVSIAMMAGVLSVNAQTATKCHDIFVGVSGGVSTVFTPDINTPAVYGNIMVGKYITPVWGVRGVIGGPFMTLDANDKNAYMGGNVNDRYSMSNKLFGELNLDGMLNISNIFADDLAKFDVYVFAGPTMNLSSKGTEFTTEVGTNGSSVYLVGYNDDLKLRVGATAGLGMAYNFTNTFALGLEARGGITPSVFGDASSYRKAEGTGRLTLNGVWTIGGKRGKLARAAAAAAEAGYISKEAAEALAAEAVAKNPKIVEKIVEKEVVKQVEKLVNNEVPSSSAVFFEIGKSKLNIKDEARLNLFADSIKDSDSVFTVSGYADKKTGSAKFNQSLSEKRAQAVYDYLVKQGVDSSKLEKQAFGGVDPIFFNNDVLSRTVIIKKK